MGCFKFVPNAFAKEAFNLIAAEYTGNNLGAVVRDAFGPDVYDKYVCSQDPLAGDRESGPVSVLINPDAPLSETRRFATAGTLYKLD